MSKRERFTCGGCGQVSKRVGAGGMYVLPGTQKYVEVILCPSCSKSLQRDPQAMTDKVEARLLTPQGAA